MLLGFIKPNYPNEKRVALLPEDINNFKNELIIERGFGSSLNISDEAYVKAGCKILDRENIFKKCEAIFSLKLIQESDYINLRKDQMIIGWSHPTGSGKEFMLRQALPKELLIVDLDNIYPAVYYKNLKQSIDWISPNFVKENSFIAGYSSVLHAIMSVGIYLNSNLKVAILGSGNVSQGAFYICSKFTDNISMFYRKNMAEFKKKIQSFDVIINGIEVDKQGLHIITLDEQKSLKENCLIVDAAADAGNAIEGTRYTTLDEPIYIKNGVYYYEVNNAPTIFYRQASKVISKAFSENVYKKDVKAFKDLMNFTKGE